MQYIIQDIVLQDNVFESIAQQKQNLKFDICPHLTLFNTLLPLVKTLQAKWESHINIFAWRNCLCVIPPLYKVELYMPSFF